MPIANGIFDSILKEFYGSSQIEKQFNDTKIFYKDINKTSEFLASGGMYSVRPLHVGRASQTATRALGNNNLPVASTFSYKDAHIPLVKHYGRIEVPGEVVKLAEGGAESFVNVFVENVNDQMEANIKDYNIDMLRGSSGELTKVNGAVSNSTSVVVDNFNTLRMNMRIDIVNSLGVQEATGVTIVDINETTKTLTLDTAVTVSDDSIIVREGNYGVSMSGLADAIATSGTYFNIDRGAAGNSFWKGKTITSAQGVITDSILTQMKSMASVAGANPKYWLCSDEVADEIYSRLLLPDKKNNEATIDGGYITFSYHGIPFLREPDDVKGRLVLVDPKLIEIHQGLGFEWAGEFSKISGKDAIENYIRNYSNMFVRRPNAMPAILGITTAYTL